MYLKSNDVKKRYSIFPISHSDLWKYYKVAEAQTWVAEEIDLSKDRFDELKDNEKTYLKNILAFSPFSSMKDQIVRNSLLSSSSYGILNISYSLALKDGM